MSNNAISDEIIDLKNRLKTAARAYYQGDGQSDMTDEEYDAAVKRLAKIAGGTDDDEVKAILDGKVAAGTGPGQSATVHHEVPMLSLLKADDEEQVKSYIDKMVNDGATGFRLQAKLDGIACSAVYVDGRLKTMSTRGDGNDGEDISYLINNENVKVRGLPSVLGGPAKDSSVEVRGELLLRTSEFNKLNEERSKNGLEEYRNPRNTNAGIVKRAMKGLIDEKTVLQFIMYKIVGDVSESDLNAGGIDDINSMTMDEWAATGHETPDSLEVESNGKTNQEVISEVMKIIDEFGPVRGDLDLPTDGIVIKPLNEVEMDDKLGHNAHHPLSQLAWKYPGARAQVKITGVEWSVGKSGRLTPRLDYDPTWFGGSMNAHATLHNPSILRELGLKIGSVVEVEKRHDVIPQVIREKPIYTPEDGDVISVPTTCPYCESKIRNDDRMSYCPNRKCPSRGAYMLKAAASKGGLDFDGMGGSLIDSLQEAGLVSDVADFYDLTMDDLANVKVGDNEDGSPRVFGETRAKHVLEYIEKSKELPYHRVLSSLSIQDFGPRTVKAVLRTYHDVDDLKNASVDDLAKVDGVGALTAERIINGINSMWPIIERLKKDGLQFHETVDDNPSSSDDRISGKRFSISGKVPDGWTNRRSWQEWIESMGGVAQAAPNADTDIMVGDEKSTSSKIVKAKKLGVKIISPEEFDSMFADLL